MADEAALRIEHLLRLREELFEEMETAERELAGLRTRVERLESDQRLGGPATDEYAQLKGHELPRTEARLVDAYNSLIKIETKILNTRRGA